MKSATTNEMVYLLVGAIHHCYAGKLTKESD